MSSFKDMLGDTLFAPAARRSDPDTSHRAARRAVNFAEGDCAEVLRCHCRHPDGLTDFDLAAIMGRQQTSVGKRRYDLYRAGLVEQTPEQRPAPSGSLSIVWRITEAGKAALRMKEPAE